MGIRDEKVEVKPSDQQKRAYALLAASNLDWHVNTPVETILERADEFLTYINLGEHRER